MGSPVPLVTGGERHRTGSDDVSSLRLTPTPAENYRCPVSTPSNFVQRHARVRRTKPLDDIYSQPTTGSRSQRSKGPVFGRNNRNRWTAPRWAPKTGQAFDYYFVDKQGDQKDEEQTNTGWLKALCSQPVNEILNKYRRKTEVKRTRVIWSKTCSTPGEKCLLDAWDNNVFGGRAKVKSAVMGGRRMPVKSNRNLRQTQSEPPFSTTPYEEDDISTPSSSRKGETSHHLTLDNLQMEKEHVHSLHVESPLGEDVPPIPLGVSPRNASPRKIREFLGNAPIESPRFVTYTTQTFKRVNKAGQETTYTKMINGPDLLPRLNGRHKVQNLLNNTHMYSPSKGRQPSQDAGNNQTSGTTGRPSSPRPSSPIKEVDEKNPPVSEPVDAAS